MSVRSIQILTLPHKHKARYGKIAGNVLNRQFSANKPNQKWVTDVTEFKINGEIVAYQMAHYQKRLKDAGLKQSMLRKGNCHDNAVMGSFLGTLKAECFYLMRYKNISELRMAIDEYIYYYNHERLKQKLKGLSPVEYRTQALIAA